MADQQGELGRNSECELPIVMAAAIVNRILLAGPISKRLVYFQFTRAEQIQLIEAMLADRSEQEVAKVLGPGDASKLIELLDLVRPPFFLATDPLRQTGSERGMVGPIDPAYVYSLLGPSLWMACTPPRIGRDLRSRG